MPNGDNNKKPFVILGAGGSDIPVDKLMWHEYNKVRADTVYIHATIQNELLQLIT